MSTYIPYTYLVGWSEQNVWYYGVRTAKNCNPSDFWVSYFTSSKFVKQFRANYGEPDVLQIRKTFSNSDKALLWEEKVIRKIALKSENWLNANCAGRKFSNAGKIPWNKGKPHSEATKAKLSSWQKGIKRSAEHVESMSLSRKGKSKSEDHKRKIGQANKGKKRTDPSSCASYGFLGKKLSPESILKRTESIKRNREAKRSQNMLPVDSRSDV